VIGGLDLEGTLHSAEQWYASAQRWRDGGRLKIARSDATATLLTDGSVLVVGGFGRGGKLVGQIEIVPDEWHDSGRTTARAWHTATLLANGAVLIAGGIDDNGHPRADVDVWQEGRVARRAPLRMPRAEHTATLLTDGTVLIVGGRGPDDPNDRICSAEVYSPNARRSHEIAPLPHARKRHTATRLADGRVLVVGGDLGIMDPTADVEIFDPSSATWTAAKPLATGRWGHAAVLLHDGRVLVAGGTTVVCENTGCTRKTVATLEVWDPARDTWSPAGELAVAADRPAMAVMADGRVVIAGGHAEVYQCLAATAIWSPK
jgi:N-acetylneuraminic acid mutarotase